MTLWRTVTVLMGSCGSILPAQDRFPDPIPSSGIAVEARTVAVVPDSHPGQPPRISVLTQDPAGRLFANDQRGPLYVIDEATGDVFAFLDLRDYPDLDLLSTSEAGFQSFAFHPDFLIPDRGGFGKFYTIHSSSNTGPPVDFDPGGGTQFHTVLLEWETAHPSLDTYEPADVNFPYRQLLRIKQPYGNHNAGLIAFNPSVTAEDPDYGNLYIAIGDGGSGGDPQGNGQDAGNPLGAILRIDPLGDTATNRQYGIVPENAFASDDNPNTLGEIYCMGLRNPQRFGWDIVTGNCFIADIGQSAVEEINLAANGANFGWNEREGSFPYGGNNTGGLTDPVAEYDHTNPVSEMPAPIGNRAVTVGEVARGLCLPPLEGMLPLADFPTGLIFLLDVDSDPLDGGQDGLTELMLLDETGVPKRFLELINAVRQARGLSASSRTDLRFSVNTPGRLFLTNKHDGHIRRIIPTVEPGIEFIMTDTGRIEVHFDGLLQTSDDLASWEERIPQPFSGKVIDPDSRLPFLRAIRR